MTGKKKAAKADVALWVSEGRKAWDDGKRTRENPYVYDKIAAYHWLQGWVEAAKDDVRQTQSPRESWPWPG